MSGRLVLPSSGINILLELKDNTIPFIILSNTTTFFGCSSWDFSTSLERWRPAHGYAVHPQREVFTLEHRVFL